MISAPNLDLYGILQVDPRAEPTVIQAAYRALARRVHPDQSGNDTSASMAVLNRAYGVLRDPGQRREYDASRTAAPGAATAAVASAQGAPSQPFTSRGSGDGEAVSNVVDFGRYQGWTLKHLARHDPEYLEWLRRHSSGVRFRRQIDELLAAKRVAAVAASQGEPTARRRR